MEVYTLKQAAHKAKMGVETLKRACEEGLLKAVKLPNRQWRIGEEALRKFINIEITIPYLPWPFDPGKPFQRIFPMGKNYLLSII